MHPGMHGSGGMMQQQEMLMMEMWNALSDDQKKEMMKRILDGKIQMKEGMIKHFQFKIETFEMLKKMLDEGSPGSMITRFLQSFFQQSLQGFLADRDRSRKFFPTDPVRGRNSGRKLGAPFLALKDPKLGKKILSG